MLKLKWLGHSSFKIKTESKTIYIDPYAGDDYSDKADIILVSHEHFDHSNKEKIGLVRLDDTVVITTKDNSSDIDGIAMDVGEEKDIDGVKINTVPAYNVNKFRSPGVPYHPKEDGKLGFIITIEGKKIYFAGDIDNIPELKDISADIALLPVSGTYVMTADEAAAAADVMDVKTFIPMHFAGGIVGTVEDAEHFKDIVERNPKKNVKLLSSGEEIDL